MRERPMGITVDDYTILEDGFFVSE